MRSKPPIGLGALPIRVPVGIQAAVSAGLGVSILPETALLPGHRTLGAKDRFPRVSDTEMALVTAPDSSPATRCLAEALADFCSAAELRAHSTAKKRWNVN
jgi:DNA-binding transcriptional LysR family regulator